MGLYAMRLIFLQLVNGDDFKAKATNTTDYNFTVTAARGDIVDSAGRRIATTATSYNVVLNKLLMGDRDLDAMLQQIVELLRKNDEKWLDTLLISDPDAECRMMPLSDGGEGLTATLVRATGGEIGRASCRERVCLYV